MIRVTIKLRIFVFGFMSLLMLSHFPNVNGISSPFTWSVKNIYPGTFGDCSFSPSINYGPALLAFGTSKETGVLFYVRIDNCADPATQDLIAQKIENGLFKTNYTLGQFMDTALYQAYVDTQGRWHLLYYCNSGQSQGQIRYTCMFPNGTLAYQQIVESSADISIVMDTLQANNSFYLLVRNYGAGEIRILQVPFEQMTKNIIYALPYVKGYTIVDGAFCISHDLSTFHLLWNRQYTHQSNLYVAAVIDYFRIENGVLTTNQTVGEPGYYANYINVIPALAVDMYDRLHASWTYSDYNGDGISHLTYATLNSSNRLVRLWNETLENTRASDSFIQFTKNNTMILYYVKIDPFTSQYAVRMKCNITGSLIDYAVSNATAGNFFEMTKFAYDYSADCLWVLEYHNGLILHKTSPFAVEVPASTIDGFSNLCVFIIIGIVINALKHKKTYRIKTGKTR